MELELEGGMGRTVMKDGSIRIINDLRHVLFYHHTIVLDVAAQVIIKYYYYSGFT